MSEEKEKDFEQEREFIKLDKKEMNLLRDILRIKQTECYYCKEKIDFNRDKYSIFNKPTRLICNSILCLSESVEEIEDEN